tara:strand:+ start:2555 stop:2809 length:255 start_codon:yes stop_codon:yes gene_type:complete
MVNFRRRGRTTTARGQSVGGVTQVALRAPTSEPGTTARSFMPVAPKETDEEMEMVDAPDQFIDTIDVNFIPVQSANGAILATLY